ncbi:MAG TPA: SpoIIE family protein phosphatase [Acidobacteriaceae bacterium]|jgi:hypothetical protein|nr:SpoIIE family protein phosphatase [Acidobacteriaceae bacterium]
MRARILMIGLTACLAAVAACAKGQSAGQQVSRVTAGGPGAIVQLAHSTYALTEWKFQPGDDLAYARPDYDDAGWKAINLEGHRNMHDPYFSADSYVPGWTALGFPNLTGYAWYRTSVKIAGNNTDLWLEMPPNFDDAYQLYVNGKLIGGFGKFTPKHVRRFYSRATRFHLPMADANGEMVLALRFYMSVDTPQWSFRAGGLHSAPVIGMERTIALLQLRNNNVNLHTFLSFLLLGLVLLIAGIVSLWLYLMDRSERAYLWLTAAFLMGAMLSIVQFLGSSTYLFPITPLLLFEDVFGFALLPLFWLLFWVHWFRLRAQRLVTRVAWSLALVELCVFACLRQPVLGTVVPPEWAHGIWLCSVILRIAFALLLVGVTVGGIRQDRAEGWIALPAIILFGITLFAMDMEVLGIPVEYFPLGIHVGILAIAYFVLALVVLGLVMRRFLRSQVHQQELVHEMEQAQAVQSLLVPEQIPQTPGYRVEGTYLPASQVGGDFYQVLPVSADGVIVVLGDVSGKGLQAAMVVSMAVGAVRAIVKETIEPAEILERLNRELTGNLKSGFVTCVCARVDTDGTVTVSNAGHLPPWVNGNEMTMEGALPLGMLAGAKYDAERFHLNDGDTLTMMSDGIVEARREKDGQLYGFDRLAALLARQPSAREIAHEAQCFGQEDDISVLSITRMVVASAVAVSI